MKKIILTLTLAASLALGFQAHSATTSGEQIVPDNDCDSNSLQFARADCLGLGSNFRAQGVVYGDLPGQDNADWVGVVCRNIKTGNAQIVTDPQHAGKQFKASVQYTCAPTQVLAGIACKDLGKNDDALDGCTAMCQTPNGPVQMLPNPDLESNNRSYVTHTVQLPNRVQAILYKEERAKTDRADCATISYAHEAIVK